MDLVFYWKTNGGILKVIKEVFLEDPKCNVSEKFLVFQILVAILNFGGNRVITRNCGYSACEKFLIFQISAAIFNFCENRNC